MIGTLLLGFVAGVCTGLGVVAWRTSRDDWPDDEVTEDWTDEDDEEYA